MILSPSKSFAGRILNSPVHLSVGKLNIQQLADISNEHVDRWIEWIKDAKQVEAR